MINESKGSFKEDAVNEKDECFVISEAEEIGPIPEIGVGDKCYNYLISNFSPKCSRNSSKIKRRFNEIDIFSRTPKCHVFPTFSEMSRSDVGFTDSDSVTA